jgi:Fur family iron response transcriptional regulator
MNRPYARTIDMLRQANIRPTRQRVGLSHLLFGQGDRHVTADQLHAEAQAAGLQVSLATVYNTLHQLGDAGLLSEVLVEPGRSYFDTNIDTHHHFYNVDTGELADIPSGDVDVTAMPVPPAGTMVDQVSIVVRVKNDTH